jgi:hypothetical protein
MRIFLGLFFAAFLSAQPTPTPTTDRETRVIRLQYVDFSNGLVSALLSMERGLKVEGLPALNSYVITGDKKSLDEAARLIKEIDVPQSKKPAPTRVFETVFYLIYGSPEPLTGTATATGLENVFTAIRDSFGKQNLVLGEVLRFRSSSSTVSYSGLAREPGALSANYHLKFTPIVDSQGFNALNGLGFHLSNPTSSLEIPRIEIAGGEKVILGSINLTHKGLTIYLVAELKPGK